MTWEKSWLAKRVVSWSSLDWDRGRWIQIDLVSGTLFDVFIHAMNTFLLVEHLTSIEGLFLAITVDALLLVVLIFNPNFAWANPAQVPDWIQKRVRPLSDEQRQEIKTIEALGDRVTSLF